MCQLYRRTFVPYLGRPMTRVESGCPNNHVETRFRPTGRGNFEGSYSYLALDLDILNRIRYWAAAIRPVAICLLYRATCLCCCIK